MSRSIPACTGNPNIVLRWDRQTKVYPRVYGESTDIRRMNIPGMGLSPRVRGIPVADCPDAPDVGSIPACTGNPPSRKEALPIRGVYPRVYGESRSALAVEATAVGLSPRVRGIPAYHADRAVRLRSIPACTGNPRSRTRRRR